MPNKLQKLTILKQKVADMQKNIQAMEHSHEMPQEIPSFLKPIHKITHRDRKHHLSQTCKDIHSLYKNRENYFYRGESKGQKMR